MPRENIVAFTLLLLAALLFAERYRPPMVWAVKPLASLGFILVALAGDTTTDYGRIILAGLVLGALGDVLLIPKSKPAFLAGLVSFLLGHLAYVVAFAARGLHPLAAIGGLVGITIVAVVVGRWLLPRVDAKMKGPVLAYIAVISLMVAAAIGTVVAHGAPIILAGAAMFFVSDLAVARNRFVAPGFSNKLWGLPLYYGGQILIALSV